MTKEQLREFDRRFPAIQVSKERLEEDYRAQHGIEIEESVELDDDCDQRLAGDGRL
jgi:hypothetical protein